MDGQQDVTGETAEPLQVYAYIKPGATRTEQSCGWVKVVVKGPSASQLIVLDCGTSVAEAVGLGVRAMTD